jgi:hypothetical protein
MIRPEPQEERQDSHDFAAEIGGEHDGIRWHLAAGGSLDHVSSNKRETTTS